MCRKVLRARFDVKYNENGKRVGEREGRKRETLMKKRFSSLPLVGGGQVRKNETK